MPPATVTSPILANQEYTLTNPDETYNPTQMYSVEPSWCDFEVTITPDSAIQPYLSYATLSETFTFQQVSDSTALSGPIETTYDVDIQLVVRDFDGAEVFTETSTYTWTIKNPCRDPSIITWNNTPQPFKPTDDYSGASITIVNDNFDVSPSLCDITISCVSVSPADTIACEDLNDANQLVKTFTSADY